MKQKRRLQIINGVNSNKKVCNKQMFITDFFILLYIYYILNLDKIVLILLYNILKLYLIKFSKDIEFQKGTQNNK